MYYCGIFALAFCSAILIDAQSLQESKNVTNPLEDPHLQETPEYSYPYVLSVKFHLRHTRVPELLTKLSLLEMPCPIEACNISLIEIAEAIQLQSYSSAEIANAIEKMNITGRDAYNVFLLYNLDAPLIVDLLDKAGTTFTDVYNRFLNGLSDPSVTIPVLLDIVKVSVADFSNALSFGNDVKKLSVLLTGNYSFENIELILNTTNKTGIDLLKTFPLQTIAKNLNKFDSAEFRNLVKNFGITSTKLLSFYKYLNVTSMNFITHSGFVSILNSFESFLNPEEVVATVKDKNTLVTSNKAKSVNKFQNENTDFVRNYSYFQAENIENPLIHYHIKNAILLNSEYKSDDIALIELHNGYQSTIPPLIITYNSSVLTNCTYVTKLPFGEVYTEHFANANTLKGHVITLPKSNTTVYNLGSPLFCQNKLAAIATTDSIKEIQFSTFMKKISDVPKPTVQNITISPAKSTTAAPVKVSKPGASSINYSNSMCILAFIIVLTICI